MAYLLGKDLLVKEGSTAIAGATSCKLSLDTEILDVTSKGSGDIKESQAGLKSWSVDVEALFPLADLDLLTKWGSTVAIDVVVGAITYTGSVIIGNISINSGVSDIATYSMTLTGSGALTKKSV